MASTSAQARQELAWLRPVIAGHAPRHKEGQANSWRKYLALCALTVALARLGERHLPRRTMQQSNAKRLLKVLDLTGNNGRRKFQLSCGCGKAAFIRHALEDTH